jgi:hypothetical protein
MAFNAGLLERVAERLLDHRLAKLRPQRSRDAELQVPLAAALSQMFVCHDNPPLGSLLGRV